MFLQRKCTRKFTLLSNCRRHYYLICVLKLICRHLDNTYLFQPYISVIQVNVMVSQTAVDQFEFFSFSSEISLLVTIHIRNGPHRFGKVFIDTFQMQLYHLCQRVEWNFCYLEDDSLFVHIFRGRDQYQSQTNESSLSSSEGGNLSTETTGVGLLEVLRSEGNVGVLLLLIVLE